MNDERFPQSQSKVGGVERGHERHLGAGQGLGKDKRRKERTQKEGVEWDGTEYAAATQTRQTESRLACHQCCHFPSAVITMATHQSDLGLSLLTSDF